MKSRPDRRAPSSTGLILLALAAASAAGGCGGASSASSNGASQASSATAARLADPPNAVTSEANSNATASSACTLAKRQAGQPARQDVTFDDIKLELKKGDPYDPALLTDKVKKLDGKDIRLRGYILPSFQQTGIKQFVLVRDNMECCFGPGALLHDCVVVEMVAPATATFTVRPVSVEGTFAIRELKLDGKILAIYHLDGRAVQ